MSTLEEDIDTTSIVRAMGMSNEISAFDRIIKRARMADYLSIVLTSTVTALVSASMNTDKYDEQYNQAIKALNKYKELSK